ncbi:ribonuclease P protein component 2 [Candidatus Woesearchaeota archaeon]|nr:ribonuclease P protein component 2 [Candidatus Woesearchaeota archaeon]
MVKTKLKPILPSLREKKRYIAFEVISKKRIQDALAVSNAIWQASLEFLGQVGTAKAGLMVLNNKWNPETQRGIIKVSNKHLDAVKASFIFASRIQGQEAIIRSLGVSGMLNKLESRLNIPNNEV